jgi:16S rRNA (cytosine967-C5)-methyltransferase
MKPAAPTARAAATAALALAAEQFPNLDPVTPDLAPLDARDRRLAQAITRAAIQRWITLELLLDSLLRQPMHTLEPALRGLLLGGAAQLLVMDRLPVHAVVDSTVELAKLTVRQGAAGLVNAVLRKFAQLPVAVRLDQPWKPAADRLPLDGGCLRLRDPLLPDPGHDLVAHLALATSHPEHLVRQWVQQQGPEAATAICEHGIIAPPTVVAVEPGFDVAAGSEDWKPHQMPGFLAWEGSHDALVSFLQGHASRRVQDPAAALTVQSTARLELKRIVDYCAGRGTKTRQLATLHPQARVFASDPDPGRFADLEQLGRTLANVTVVPPAQLAHALGGEPADLLLLDVPCSNTAVLGRRAEARYRYTAKTRRSLIDLQRRIMCDSAALARPAYVLYATCSLLEQENQEQITWLCDKLGGSRLHEQVTLPAGVGASFHDGSYHALVRLP